MKKLLYILSLLLSITFSFAQTTIDQGVKEVTIDFPIGGITYSATPPPGKITITGSDGGGGTGSTVDYPGGKDYQFKDKAGNIWTVDENGTVTQNGKVAEGGASNSTNTDGVTGSGNNATVNQYTAKGIKIEWKENAGGQFAYDTAEKTKLPKDKYPSVKDSDNNTVYVPYKATVNKQTELFDAKVSVTDPTLKDAKIIFKTLSVGKAIEATEINKTDTERNYQLKLVGAFDYAEEEVIAVLMPKDAKDKQQVISSFRLIHLSPKTVDVSLVPLDANSQSKLQSQGDKLNQIYKKIGINFNVKKESVLDISSIVSGDTINSEDADLMSTYSPQQQQINALYKGTDTRYVLFVTDKKSSTGQKGYMRLNGQFGYVYNNAQDKTGAHELGHGIFKLEHPWKAYGTSQSATPLLMDYSTGEELSHLDWKQINDPAFKLYSFQGQSSGELAGKTWFTPDWKPLKLKTTSTISSFIGHPKGTVPGVVYNGTSYKYQNGKYTNDKNEPLPSSEIVDANPSGKEEVYLYVIENDLCNVPTYSTTYEYAIANKENIDYTNSIVTPKEIWRCPKNNVDSSYQIITQDTDKTLQQFYEELRDTYNKAKAFYQNCNNQQWKPGKEPGIVPKCFWENTTTTDYYDVTDVAFMSGIIDGGYAEVDGIVEMINLISSGKIEEKINDLAYAYTWAYLECKDKDIKLNKTEYKTLLDKLAQAQQDTGIWSWVKEKYYEPKVEDLGEKIKTCEDANQLRADISDTLIEIKESIDSWEEIKTHAKNIKNKISGYYNLITSKENAGRYEAGRLVIPVASTVIPIVGQVGKISKISKAKTVLKGIEELSETKTDDLVEKLIVKGKEENLLSVIRQLLSKPSYLPNRIIWSKPNKTITFIGKWSEEIAGQQNGLQKVFGELSESDLNIYMNSGKFDHPGGFNMLSIDNFGAKEAEYLLKKQQGVINSAWSFDDYIWEAYNKPWLESSLQRGDDIVIWSDPINSRNGFYKRELDFIQSQGSKYGYDYNNGISKGTFTK